MDIVVNNLDFILYLNFFNSDYLLFHIGSFLQALVYDVDNNYFYLYNIFKEIFLSINYTY